MGDGTRYTSRELRANDIEAIQRLVTEGRRWETLFLGNVLRGTLAENPDFWWYGALADGTRLEAVMGVQGHSAVVYGANESAVDALARDALRSQQNAMPSPTARHQLLGEAATIGRFWRAFKKIGREVVVDKERALFASLPDLTPPSKRATVRVATAADGKLVAEFTAEQVLESQGYDPRRLSRQSHEARCQRAIAEGRAIVAFQGPKPVMVAEVEALDEATAVLQRVFVPRPSRALKRLVGAALVLACQSAPAAGREVVFLAETDTIAAAAERAGFPQKATYRSVVMKG